MMEKSRSFPEYSRASGLDVYGGCNSYSFNGPGRSSGAGDPEAKRKRRIASYNLFTMEAKLKSSVKNSFKWIKNKLANTHYGG